MRLTTLALFSGALMDNPLLCSLGDDADAYYISRLPLNLPDNLPEPPVAGSNVLKEGDSGLGKPASLQIGDNSQQQLEFDLKSAEDTSSNHS